MPGYSSENLFYKTPLMAIRIGNFHSDLIALIVKLQKLGQTNHAENFKTCFANIYLFEFDTVTQVGL